MRILVSGGTGFVGRFIVEELLTAGHSVTIFGRSTPPADFFSAPIRFVAGALDPARDQTAAFEDVDCFVHAALDHLPERYRGGEGGDAEGFRRSNLDGGIALFDQAKAAGVRRVVFLSSRAVYGGQPPGAMLDEETKCRPDTLYGEVKLAGEQALRAMSDGKFAAVSLRITGVYGPPGPGRDHKWSKLFSDYLAGREIAPRVASEVHGADVAAAVRLMLESPLEAVSGQVFNVSDLVLDRRDLLARIKAATGAAHALPPRADASALNVMETRKLRALGWRPGGVALLDAIVAEWRRGMRA